MTRIYAALAAAVLAVGGYFFSQHFELDGLENISVRLRDEAPRTAITPASGEYVRGGETIRIASFNIQVFGQSKLGKPQVMDLLAHTVRQFDVIAIQEVRSEAQDVLPRFVQQINSTGRRYDFIIGPRLGRTSSKEQYAFVFDTETIQTDRSAAYTLSDPDDLLHREPYVGWFRTVRAAPAEAFTFSLVNIHTDPDEVDLELNVLDDAFQAVRNDDRREDDVILLGDLNASPEECGELAALPGVIPLIRDTTTNTAGNKLYDNLFLHREATAEFTGRAGVFDLIREYNLTRDQAQEVSDHFPVWGEFSIYEGGVRGPIAARPDGAVER